MCIRIGIPECAVSDNIQIILVERRQKLPKIPRWLRAAELAEEVLDSVDTGQRYYNNHKNVQLDSLQISFTVAVGRHVILAQPVRKLPSRGSFRLNKEGKRFTWLLYGTEEEAYEIHGGCGFSKKLLHMISQVTFLSAKMMYYPNGTAEGMSQILLSRLRILKQWSREARDWERTKAAPQPIQVFRKMGSSSCIMDRAVMTEVTAECWRLAIIAYLQCRLLRYGVLRSNEEPSANASRLPRNHPEVLKTLDDVAICTRVLPTSGHCFSAQAPLFPVFLLGLLSTKKEHRQVCDKWMKSVVETPVRSVRHTSSISLCA